MKILFIVLAFAFALGLSADMVEVEEYMADIHSKDGAIKQISLTMVVEGDDVLDESHKFYDALGIVISSYYVEDLFTSQGKEKFKKSLKKYLQDKYMIIIDDVFLQQLTLIRNVEIDKILDAIRREGICKN